MLGADAHAHEIPPRLAKRMSAVAEAASSSAPVVDGVGDPAQVAGQHGAGDEQRQDPEGQVDVEDPAPRQVRHAQAADERPDHGGDGEHGAEQAHVAAAVARRHDVADDRLGPDHQTAAAQALQGPEGDQLGHGVAETGQGRTDDEDDDRGLEEGLAPVLVAQLPPQRRGHRRRQQVGGHHPGQVRPPVQVPHDGGQRGRDDGLVEGGEEHAQQQGTEDQPQPALGDLLGHGRCCGDAHTHLPTSASIGSE